MRLVVAVLSVCSLAGMVAQSADAGCKCGLPPAPAATGVYGGPGYGTVGLGDPAMGWPGGPGMAGASGLPYGGVVATNGPHWAPGGYESRVGSPVYYHDPAGGQFVVTGNPYYDHLGPGFQRDSIHGHYRFPYYNYRAPWYFPGRAVYNRNTNFAW